MGGEGDDFPIGHDELVSELGRVRRDGLHRVPEVAVPRLLRAAAALGVTAALPLRVRLETVLGQAVERLGAGRIAESARCTFGLTHGTRLRSAQERRHAAASAQSVSPERFRRAQEPELLAQVAVEIVALLALAAAPEVPLPRPPADDPIGRPDLVRLSTLQDESEYSLARLLDGAVRVAVYGRTWVNLFAQHGGRLRRIVEDGGELRVVLLQADSPAGDQIYVSDVWSGAHILTRNLATSHDRLREIQRAVGVHPGVLEVRETTTPPQFGFVATSTEPGDGGYDRAIVQLNFVYTRVEADRPMLCLGSGSVAIAMWAEEFEAAWASATPWAEPVA